MSTETCLLCKYAFVTYTCPSSPSNCVLLKKKTNFKAIVKYFTIGIYYGG